MVNNRRFYDEKAAQQRVGVELDKFLDELKQRVYPNEVSFNHFSHGVEVFIWKHDEPCFGEKYVVRYNGVDAQYRFQGDVRREYNANN